MKRVNNERTKSDSGMNTLKSEIANNELELVNNDLEIANSENEMARSSSLFAISLFNISFQNHLLLFHFFALPFRAPE